jgi:DNA-binding LacI/PurR family transcriptional regulator
MDGKINITSQDLRAQGFKHYMDMNGDLRYSIFTQKDFYSDALSVIRSGNEKTAFFCSSDMYALELLKFFRLEGVIVPGDAGLMGFDNLDLLTYISPRLTSVSTSLEIVGKEAITILLKLIANETVPDTCYVPHVICPGETL